MSKAITLLGLEVSGMSHMMELCKQISETDFVPKEKKNKPMECLLAIQYAAEVGLSPMFGLQNIHVINGKPSLGGDAMLALVKQHKDFISCDETIEGEGENMTAICELKRVNHKLHVSTYTVQDAKTAKLWGKSTTKDYNGKKIQIPSPWVTYPKRMLRYRALTNALRDVFPDAVCGLITTEEAHDYPTQPVKNITPTRAVLEQKSLEVESERDLASFYHAEFSEAEMQKAIRFTVDNPQKVDQMIAKIEKTYAITDEQKDELRNLAQHNADEVSKDEEVKND